MLTFNLKKEWFEKIKSGEKTHEYREYKPYWRNRLEKCIGDDFSATRLRFGNTVVIEYPHYITFVCGYAPKGDKNKRLKARLISIRLIDGRETDLHIDKPVYDIKFELIGDKKMTNKEQIIIDIDRCKYRDKYTNFCLAEKDDIGETYTICTGTDCYYKQLARKTQECEELKIKNNDYLETINSLDYLQSCYKTSYEGARGAIEMIAKDCTDKTAIYYATIALLYLGFAKKSILNNYTKRQNKARGEE